MRKPEKKIFWVWLIQAGLLSLVPSLLLGLGIGAFTAIPSFISLTGAILLFTGLASIYTVHRYRAWGFELREDHLYLEHGVFRKVKTMVPFVRIQHVDSQRNVVERLAGISHVVVYTAGSRGADVTVPGLLPREAEKMQEKLRDVAIESEDRDGV